MIYILLVFTTSCASSMMSQKTIIKKDIPPFIFEQVYFTANAIQKPGNIYQMGAQKGYKYIDAYVTIENKAKIKRMINYKLINMAVYDGNIQNVYPPYRFWRGHDLIPQKHKQKSFQWQETLKPDQKILITLRYALRKTSQPAGLLYLIDPQKPIGRFWFIKP